MKRVGVFLFVLLFSLLVLQSYSVGASLDDVESGLEGELENLEDAGDTIESISEGEWDYLSKEWEKIFLKNKFISSVDSFFQNFSFLFVFFFGEGYSFSLVLLFIAFLWFFFFFKFREILVDYSMFSNWVAVVIAAGLTVILAQIGWLRGIVEWVGWLVFTQDAIWLRILIYIGVIVFLVFLYKTSSLVGDIKVARREKLEKELEKINRTIIGRFANSIVKGLGGD